MDKINPKHYAFLILATCIVSLKTYPKVFIQNGLRDSWVAVITSSILILLFLIYVIKTCQKNNVYNLVEIFQGALGKTFGNVMLGLFCLTLFFTLVESAAVEASSMHTNMLVATPVWFFILFFVGPAIYTLKQDLVAIITVTLIGISLIIIAGMNLAAMTHPYKDYSLLFPVFARGISGGFILSILQTLGLFGCVSITFPYLVDVTSKKRLLLYAVLGILFVIQMQIVSTTGVIATFDISRINQMPYPKLLQTQLVSHFRFLEAGELFVMLQIVGGWYIKYVVTFYALIKILKGLKINTPYMIYIISLMVAISAYLAGNDLFVLFRFLAYYTYIAFVGFVVIPTFVFAVFSFKNQKSPSGNV
ncbi:GerAB/ArcD/ProY family transporter [Alkaliphilus hydrothermalis]|uniref:Spore germination protein (Amino acid permease) n=1 Tax=Alkaliphilus hydrothermalis TaxID=1482730 RepID=A0ABS2NPG7_9FIRM|nr:endospore germination permease [Alkaliphilus hydrothermalis]MBM7614816.1 spore germination protein (amino acid permease) [Alkaliphilus hydrothermalis]